MSRRKWFILVGIPVVLAILAGSGAGYFLLREYRDRSHLAAAEKAVAEGRFWEARREYAYYLSKNRGDLEVLAKYAKASEAISVNRRGAVRDAGSAYFRIARETPNDSQAVKMSLDFYRKHASWPELLYAADHFLGQKPDDYHLLYYKAIALDQLLRKQDAIDAYSLYIEKGADTVDVYGNLARLQKAQGFTEQAAATLEQARKRFPNDPKVNFEVARCALQDNQLTVAQLETDKALELAPNDVDILLLASQMASRGTRWDDAQRFAEKAFSLDPTRGEAYLLIAQAQERQNKPELAVETLAKIAPSVKMDNPDLFYALAEQQISLKKYDDAHITIEEYRKAYPDSVMIIDYLMAREMLSKGDAANAAQKLSVVAKSLPEFTPAKYYLAVAYIESNQKDLAHATLESFLQAHPDDERMKLLRDSVFSDGASTQDPKASAETLLTQEAPTPQALLLAAERLMRTKDSDPQLIRKLIDMCIKQDPTSVGAYLMLVEQLIRLGEIDTAKETVLKAEAAGVPAGKIGFMRAALAFVENDSNRAYSFFTESLALPDIKPDEVVRWAQFFTNRGSLDLGLKVLTDGLPRFEGESRLGLEIQQVSLCVQARDFNRALDILNKVAPEFEKGDPENLKQLNTERMRIADALLSSTKPEERTKGEALMAEVAKKDPENADVRLMRANICLRKEPPDYAGAEKLCLETLNAAPQDLNALLLLGELAGTQGQYARAMDLARRAEHVAAQDPRVQMAIARALMNLQRNREAVAVLEPILATHPGDRDTMELLVRAFGAGGQLSQADKMLEMLRKAAGQDEVQLRKLGSLMVWLQLYHGQFAEVEKMVRSQYEADPRNTAAAQMLASALIGLKRFDDAEKILVDNAEQNSSNPERWTALARFHLSRNDRTSLAAASTALTRALIVAPDYAPALREQIQLQARAGNAGVALSLCDRYLNVQPSDVDVLFQKALLLSRDPAQKEEALRVLSSAIAMEERSSFLSLRGAIYLDTGKYREALTDFQKLSSTQGVKSGQLDAAMAEAQLGLKEYELAQTFLDSAKQKAASGETVDADRLKRIEKGILEGKKP